MPGPAMPGKAKQGKAFIFFRNNETLNQKYEQGSARRG
jgi:hypothetical protein